jgi:hypothetical protein
MKNGDGLQELIQCERQAELEPKRIDRGWNRLADAVSAGCPPQLHYGSEMTLRLARTLPVRLKAAVLAIGGLSVVTMGSLWYSLQRTPVSLENHELAKAASSVSSLSESRVPNPVGSGAALLPSITDNAVTMDSSDIPSASDVKQTDFNSTRGRKGNGLGPESTSIGHSDTFDQELSLIKAAKHAFDLGDDGNALSLLAEHARRFPRGVFAGEREALRVLARCSKEQSSGSRKMAEAFIRSYPSSPMIDRIAKACRVEISQNHK